MTPLENRFAEVSSLAIRLIPGSLPPWGRGWSAAVASILEASAAKPGNVHPNAAFDDLSHANLVAAGIASGSILEAAPERSLGETVLQAVVAARAVAGTNANLGIILLVAPMAAVPGGHAGPAQVTATDVEAVLAAADHNDAAAIWQAIQLAQPGGMGRSERFDLAGPAPPDIRASMREAADRDMIARLWTAGYQELFAGPVADLATAIAAGVPTETAIIRCHLRQLARQADSLIARRHGAAAAAGVSARAAELVARESEPDWRSAVAAFDATLRSPRRLNPGTTADLVAAAIYSELRAGRLEPPQPIFCPSSTLPSARLS